MKSYVKVTLFLAALISASFLWKESSTNKDVPVLLHASLGGVPVAIPTRYVGLVEYDSVGVKKDFKKNLNSPEYLPVIRSFGLEISYPKMDVVEWGGLSNKHSSRDLLRVVVNSGENYGSSGDNFLENLKVMNIERKQGCPASCFEYVAAGTSVDGLREYTPRGPGINEKLRYVNGGVGAPYYDKNIYLAATSEGKLTTYIECGNRSHSNEVCSHYFTLSPSMRIHGHISYPRKILSEWKRIQKSVGDVIYSFRDANSDLSTNPAEN